MRLYISHCASQKHHPHIQQVKVPLAFHKHTYLLPKSNLFQPEAFCIKQHHPEDAPTLYHKASPVSCNTDNTVIVTKLKASAWNHNQIKTLHLEQNKFYFNCLKHLYQDECVCVAFLFVLWMSTCFFHHHQNFSFLKKVPHADIETREMLFLLVSIIRSVCTEQQRNIKYSLCLSNATWIHKASSWIDVPFLFYKNKEEQTYVAEDGRNS